MMYGAHHTLKLFYSRGLPLLVRPMRGALMSTQQFNFSLINSECRDFSTAKKSKKGRKPGSSGQTDAEVTTQEDEQVSPSSTTEAPQLDQALYQPFSVGDVKKIQSTPDHKPPSQEDTIPGRYATVLFTTASQNNALYDVFEDMKFLADLYQNSESFQLFTKNAGVGLKEIALFNQGLRETADIHDVTIRFIEVLAENKRLVYIKEVADKYAKLYQQFNKEEKITIISAYKLTGEEEQQVLAALKANPQNKGKEFVLEFKVEENILGGLQMYTESEFMDMSLASRVDRLNQEIQKMVD